MLRSLLSQSSRLLQTRSLHSSRPALSLQNIFETSDRPSLTIAKLTPKGFHLSDDLVVPGGLVLAGYQALLWDVDPPKGDGAGGIGEAWKGWTKERFQVFESVVPRPGTLHCRITGRGCNTDLNRNLTLWNWPDSHTGAQGDQRLREQSRNTTRCHGLGTSYILHSTIRPPQCSSISVTQHRRITY